MDHRAGGSSRRCLTPSNMFRLGYTTKPNELPRRPQLLPFSYIGPKACCIRRRAINPITISRHQCQSHFCHIQNCKHLRYHRTPPNSSSRSPFSRLRSHMCCAPPSASPCCCLLYLAHSLSSAQTMWHRQCGTCVSLEACCPLRRNNSKHGERVWCGVVCAWCVVWCVVVDGCVCCGVWCVVGHGVVWCGVSTFSRGAGGPRAAQRKLFPATVCVVRCVVRCVVWWGMHCVVCVGVAWSSVWCVVWATRLQLDTARKLPWHHPARLQ